jgi:hypothetical protein
LILSRESKQIFILFIIMDETCKECATRGARIVWSFLQIFLGVVIIFAITVWIIIVNYREHIDENFEEYRCKAWMLPFVNWIRPDISVQDNFNQCMSSSSAAFFAVLSSPVSNTMGSMGSTMNDASVNVSTLESGVNVIGATTIESLDQADQDMSKLQKILYYLLYKLKAIFDKIGVIIIDIVYAFVSVTDLITVVLLIPELILSLLGTMTVVMLTLTSIMSVVGFTMLAIGLGLMTNPFTFVWGTALQITATTVFIAMFTTFLVFSTAFSVVYFPLKALYDGADNGYCCFESSTKVIVSASKNNFRTRNIRDLKPGDIIYPNQRVKGIFEVTSNKKDWYKCGKTVVSGDHKMWDESTLKWTTVSENKQSEKLNVFCPSRFCIVCEKHWFVTPDGIFQDFQETEDPHTLYLDAEQTLQSLNNQVATGVHKKYEKGEVQAGLHSDVAVKTDTGFTPIKDLFIGSFLSENNEVLGIYTIGDGNHVRTRYKQISLPSDQIVFDETCKAWKKAYSLENTVTSREKFQGIGYHLITKRGTFSVESESGGKNILIRDFLEKATVAV